MRLETAFEVAATPDQAWQDVLDTSTLIQCVPGFAARPRAANGIQAGELTISRNGAGVRALSRLRAIDADIDQRTASIEIEGREVGGPAIASGLLTASVVRESGTTRVLLSADVDLAGHRAPADAVLAVGQRLLDEFGAALGQRMSERPRAGDERAPQPPQPPQPREEPEVLDLGSVLGERILARYGPHAVSLACIGILARMALRKPPQR